jgi:16S rRNA processing protein RimM
MYTDHVKIGTVVSKHGYKGDIKISVSSNNLVTFPDLKYLFIELDDCFIPFKIDNVRSFSKNVLIVKLEEIRSEDEVDEVIHKNIYADSTEMESNIDSGIFYNDLINFDVFRDSKKIGKIENINSRLPQPVFEIMYDSRIVLIPIHKDFIRKIDKENNIIYLDIPNGLLEII